ncbi:MAG: hypothetical protein M1828_002685 [Chrysothrix sp. TS-e1954]|nr:MAG: hypothetical protein M1828_002685 [Chrysothrix sp. TS-e1954]
MASRGASGTQATSAAPSIPLIDFTPFLTPTTTPPRTRQETATALLNALTTSGFLYITTTTPSAPLLSSIFTYSAWFFALPQHVKEGLPWDRPESNRGYSCMGREKVTDELDKESVDILRESAPDLKESLEIGRDGVVGMPNQWPELPGREGEVRGFREAMGRFFEECKVLHMWVMRALAVGLFGDLGSEGWFDGFTDQGDNTLRLLHYPEVRRSREVVEASGGKVRAGAHTDYGSVTLLFQDERGGLQVKSPEGWVDVKPIPGTIVVNAGDLLARWSNDVVRSTLHRVVEPPAFTGAEQGSATTNGDTEWHPARYSIAYFCNPDFDKTIDAIPGTVKEGEAKKYEAVNSGEYLVQRLTATY